MAGIFKDRPGKISIYIAINKTVKRDMKLLVARKALFIQSSTNKDNGRLAFVCGRLPLKVSKNFKQFVSLDVYIYMGNSFSNQPPPAHFIFAKKNIYYTAKFLSSFLVFDAIWPFPKSINHNLEFSLLSRSLPEKTVFFFFYISCLKK